MANVTDHCHYKCKYRDQAHLDKENIYISLITHNSSRYSNHSLILKSVQKFKNCNFLCIGGNTGKYIFFH